MTVTWEEAVNLVDQLRQYESVTIQRMLAIRAHYNADVLMPTYDVPGEETPGRVPGPLLIADTIDKNASRAASVMPSIAMQDKPTKTAQARLKRRRDGMYGVWHASAMKEALLGRAFRHLFAYGTVSMIAVEDDSKGHPLIKLRDPLSTYSEPKSTEDFCPPKYMACVYGKSEMWLRANYPETKHTLFHGAPGQNDQIWDVMEYVDEDQIMIGVLGPRHPFYYGTNTDYIEWRREHRDKSMMLRRYNNWAGMVPGYTSRRVTLDRIESQVMKLTGLVNEIGRMRTLEKIAAERSVFPDIVAFSDSDEAPVLLNGDWVDGRDGELNILQGASGFQVVRMDPSVVSRQVTDLMENAFMQSGGLDPQMIGEARGASLRTAKALNSMAGMSLDPQIQEAHNSMARILSVVNTGCMELWKNRYGSKRISMFSGRPGDMELTEISPKDDITNSMNNVYYPIPGADLTNIQVALGQAQQTDQMSDKTARATNPLIADADFEEKQLVIETMDKALLAGFLTQANNPQDGGTLVDLAKARNAFRNHGDLPKAIIDADEEARQRQAAASPSPEEQVGGLEPQNPGAVAQGMPPGGAPPGGGFASGPSERGNQLNRVLRNLNSRPTSRNSIPV